MKKIFTHPVRPVPIKLLLLLLVILCIPTFMRMLQPGIYSMQDFPYFRLVEYSKCLQDLQIPCRWAPDAGLGFGEPVFNFYSHIPFFIGGGLIQIGVSAITSLKFLFAFSLIGSAVGMFLLSRLLWKNNSSALISSLLYLYAPYRAVNVWVRGALPESFAFIIIPFILFFFEKYREQGKIKWLFPFTISISLLILTHNLSVLLFGPAIGIYIVFRLLQEKSLRLLIPLVISGCAAVGLSGFYLLPTIVEAGLVNLQTTTVGYFDFRAHFVTIPQLFISRFWGYGGSTWGDEDGLSLAIGQVQWITSGVVLVFATIRLIKNRKAKESQIAILLILLALLGLFFTHNQSAFIWEAFSPVMKYIQFPWRFLGISLFLLSLGSGYIPYVFSRYRRVVVILIICTVIISNYSFFHEDIWNTVNDTQMQSTSNWIEQSRASIGDYWPIYGPIPTVHSSEYSSQLQPVMKSSDIEIYQFSIDQAETVEFPITYFPTWQAVEDGTPLYVVVSKNGLVSVPLEKGNHKISFYLVNSVIRSQSNWISLFSLLFFTGAFILMRKKKKLS